MSKKKVLQLRSSLGFFGAENVIIELAKQLQYSDYYPIVGVFENNQNPNVELAEVAKRYNIETVVFKCNGQFDLRTVCAIRNYVKKKKIKIIQSHGYKADIYALLATVFQNVKLIATCHPWIINSRVMKFYAKLDQILLYLFDYVVVVCDDIKKIITRGASLSNKISTIENGIDVTRFIQTKRNGTLYTALNIPKGSIVIGVIARLSSEKGHITLVEASKTLLAEFPNLIFLIVGDGPYKEALLKKISELGLNNQFIFAGIREDIPAILNIMDIFVLPSLTEGLPMALLEAMVAQKPIIATKVGSIPRVVQDKKSGILIKPNDIGGLTAAIKSLLKNTDKAKEYAKKGQQIVIRDFSAEGMTQKYISIYNRILCT